MGKQEIFEETLSSPYDANAFVDFIREMIIGVKIISPENAQHPYDTFSYYVNNYYHVAEYGDADGNSIGIFAVELKRGESVENARSAQRSFVKKLLERGGYDGALVGFYSTNALGLPIPTWRFSFIRMDYEFAEGKLSKNLTPAKRYSYLVGQGEPCHTAMDRLLPIFQNDNAAPTLDDLEEAFSVETVTNEFFEQYKDKYLEMKEFLENNEDFMEEAEHRGFTSEQFTKKLLAQIVFLYFVQKKGWLGVNAVPRKLTTPDYKRAFHSRGAKSRAVIGDLYSTNDGVVYNLNMKKFRALSPQEEEYFSTIVKGQPWGTGPKDFMRHIFNDCEKSDLNFFDDYLEPLFYTGLNRNRGDDAYFLPLHCRIPFLNGGLFEELDNYDWQNNDFAIPNEMFSNAAEKGREADGVLDIFDRYNFTMAEDEPMEREVAVDPEMLGKVFENLLEVKDRKSKGAFYTPREIVHYMCQESLINYLTTKSNIPEEDIRKLVLYGEYFKGNDVEKTLPIDNKTGKIVQGQDIYKGGYHMELDKQKSFEIPATIFSYKDGVNRLAELDKLLANVKVVDPAVGSGAFPLGLLNEIVKTRDTLSTYMAIEMSPTQKKQFYAPGFVGSRNPYDLKAETIKNCIFACDIEPSATDIAKLRLWLSLVIDDELTEHGLEDGAFGEHSKPKQLPNLDCNIICGNSLVDSFEGVDLINESDILKNIIGEHQENFMQAGVDNMISTLIALQDKIFYTTEHHEKEQIKSQIQGVYDSIIEEQLQFNPELLEKYRASLIEASRPFVLWQLYFPKVFRDNGGFDICIGNPPYVDSEEMVKSMPEDRRLYAKTFKCAKGNWDLFIIFIEQGMNLLNNLGTISFIVPNKLVSAPYSTSIRKYMANNRIIEIRDYSNVNVFASAAVYPVVFRVQHGTAKTNVKMVLMSGLETTKQTNIVSMETFYEDIDWDKYFNADGKALAIIDKIKGNPSLGTIAKVNGAATVGEAYSIKEFLLDAEPQNNDLIKFINTGGIDKYYSYYGIEKIRYLKGSYDYPSVKLSDLIDMSEKRAKESQSEKIIIGGMNKEIESLYDKGEYLAGKSTTIVYEYEHLRYITAVLNSSLMTFYYRTYFNSMSLQGGYLRIGAPQIKQLPIAIPDDEIVNRVELLVDEIQDVLLKDNSSIFAEEIYATIDELIFNAYDITEKEKEIIIETLK